MPFQDYGYKPSGITRPRARPKPKATSSSYYSGNEFGSGNIFTETSSGASTVNFGNNNNNDNDRGSSRAPSLVQAPTPTVTAPAAPTPAQIEAERQDRIARVFEAAGATLPEDKGRMGRVGRGIDLYSRDIFTTPFVATPDNTQEIKDYLQRTAVDDALRDALDMPEVYRGMPTQEEPETNIDMSVLQGALQPEPITVEELPDVTVKAGDTLSAIAAANNLPVQDVIDANPQIANPDMIRPGEKVKMPDPRNLGGSEGYGNPVGDLSIFSKPVDNSYTEFMDIEGDTSHLGGADYKEVGITLPMGIVPTSGLKYTHNGKTIDLPDDRSKRWAALSKAGVTLNNFDSSNVDMSQVVKDGIKRSDYDTDENFTKAVLTSFEDSVIKEIENEGVDVDKIDDATLEGLISLAWNVQGHKWKDIEPAYKEMVKDNPDMTKVQSGMLQVFTSGGIVVRGLAERRAKDYNKVAEGMGQPTIESYTPVKLKNGNAGFEYAMSDGTTVTRDTGKDYATKASQSSFKKHLNKATSL